MCLIAFAWGASERFPFVVAANRDEFYERPTAPLAQWRTPSGATVVSGRDLKDGGTWMGFSPNGRFAMLTNVRNPQAAPPQEPISRGHLALSWLETQLGAIDWAQSLEPRRYQGFNLIIGDGMRSYCYYLSNQTIDEENRSEEYLLATGLHLRHLPTGAIYGLSNAALDTPWPKTRALKSALQSGLAEAESFEQLNSKCLEALRDTEHAQRNELPSTGLPEDVETALSSVFVRHSHDGRVHYGTRSSLFAASRSSSSLGVIEVTHQADGITSKTRHITLDWR
jgi:uncharacterized protein with NRDE domain